MAVIQSLGALVEVRTVDWYPTASYGSLTLYNQLSYDYATLYRTQPNIRTCVDFLARNIAQLGLHVFRRVNETDRVRLRDHGLAQVIARPLPAQFKVTRYRLINKLVSDLGIYDNAYWLKVRRAADGALAQPAGAGSAAGEVFGLMRIPPSYVTVKGGLVPTGYSIALAGGRLDVGSEEIVHVFGYNAQSAISGLSSLETLRRVLAEEHAAGDYREYFWRNAARQGGVITRPPEAPEWSPTARERFKTEFEQLYSGTENSGKTAILEEGMDWKAMAFSAQESEYLAGRKLTREECARAYHIPLPMVGILDHATFSNIKEQHKNLYQDALGPWLKLIEEDIGLQLLPEFEDSDGVYCEFNILEKLAGSFDEQSKALQSAVGRPWMTADEARARMNMPSMGGDAARLVTPLNVLMGALTPDPSPTGGEGGKASAALALIKRVLSLSAGDEGRGTTEVVTTNQEGAPGEKAAAGSVDPTRLGARARHELKWREVLERTFGRQRDAVLGKVPEGTLTPDPSPTRGEGSQSGLSSSARGEGSQRGKGLITVDQLWDAARWNRELGEDIFKLNSLTAMDWARYVAAAMGLELDEDVMAAWLLEHSRVQAEYINGVTETQIGDALAEDEPRSVVRRLFEVAIGSRAAQIAVSAVTTASVFGSQEAARQGGLRTKTWQVNSSNPRDAHIAMNGETVGIRERFSNGMLWPGDPAGGADNNAGCMCTVVFGR